MRVSNFFVYTFRESPLEAQIVSHKLMLRSGMIYQICNGIYSWMPLGLRVLSKIEKIVSLHQESIGSNRISMPTIQPAALWEESGRYCNYGKEMLRMKDRHDKDILYGPTHEEVITDIARHFIKSYKQLPLNFFQINWKFRDEIRPRFGVMRCREFLMKDGYSFDINREGAVKSYEKNLISYIKTFANMGLRVIPVRADSGAIGGDLSHEFHVLANTGESEIFYDSEYENIELEEVGLSFLDNLYSAADEKHVPEKCPIKESRLKSARGIEVGHVFYFGTKYSKSMNLAIMGQDGKPFFPEMGSYGIGVSRLVGAIIEANHDERGIVWPESVAPFRVVIIITKSNNEEIKAKAEEVYQMFLTAGIEVLLDDRNCSAGVKFCDMDLIGIPYQIIIGDKSKSGIFEVKNRKNNERSEFSQEELINRFVFARDM